MRLSAILTRDELALALESMLPLRIVIDAERGRSVTFENVELELVRGTGLRLRGTARIAWDVAGVAVPITVQSWQVLLEPRVGAADRADAPLLTCLPTLEKLELKNCPSLIDGKIADAVASGIAKAKNRLAWDFGHALSRHFALPPRIDPTKAVEMTVRGGACAVTDTELALRVELSARAVAVNVVRPPESRRGDAPPASRRAPTRWSSVRAAFR